MTKALTKETQQRLATNIGLVKKVLAKYGDNYVVRDGKLFIGTYPLAGNNEFIDSLAAITGGVMTVFHEDVRVATNVVKADGSRAVGTKLAQGPAYDAVVKNKKPYHGEAVILEKPYITVYDPIFDKDGNRIGILFAGMKKSEQLAAAEELTNDILMISVVVGLVLLFVVYFVVRGLLRPLTLMEEVMARLQHEDVNVEIPGQNRGDEIGRMAKAVQAFKESIIEKISLRGEAEKQKENAEKERKAALVNLAESFEKNVGKVVDTVASASVNLQSDAKNLLEVSDQTNAKTSAVAAATEQASSNVQTVAAAAEELAASINEINRQIEQSTQVASEAVVEVKRTDTTVSTLSDAAAQIGEVVKLIQDIAAQTNLLALNATIEAARAGEAGKGFAVVASEVKNLANQTGRATEEISQKIITVQTVSKEAVGAIRSIGTIIERIDEITRTIALAIKQQENATHEISNNVQQVSVGTTEISSNIVNVTHAVGEAQNAATEVFSASNKLSKQAELLRQEIASFVSSVRQG